MVDMSLLLVIFVLVQLQNRLIATKVILISIYIFFKFAIMNAQRFSYMLIYILLETTRRS